MRTTVLQAVVLKGVVTQGVKPVDVVVTGTLMALGVWLSVEVITSTDLTMRVDSHSWLQLPVFQAAVVPVLWWRRGLITVAAISCAAMLVHLVVFGALVRCGAGLPLAFVVAFLSGLAYPDVRRRVASVGLAVALATLVLLRDTAAGPSLIPVVTVLCAGLFGIGCVVAHRAQLARDLKRSNEDLRALRDQRAALDVHDDRALLSSQLETLLDQRLTKLAAVAENGAAASDPAATKAILMTLEDDSRQTLGEMREIVGLLRGGEVALAPTPSVAHLDALLARHLRPGARIQVTGDPRVLPASVELSAYRIVEHLVTALADDASTPVAVAMTFADDALEIQVSGLVTRGADIRAAVSRARERTRLHAGSLDVRVARGKARVVAHLPVLSGV